MFSWQKKIEEHIDVIQRLSDDKDLITKLEEVGDLLVKTFQKGGKLLICGNGGSASDAQHIAGELVSRFYLERPGLYAEALTANVASLTAIGNDYAYERIFQRQVEAMGRPGDILIGLSTSGGSKNVALAFEEARKKGMVTIGITGSKRDSAVAKVADHCLHIPSTNTPRIQEAYLFVGHTLCEFVELKLFA